MALSATSICDVVAAAFGEELGPDLLAAVPRMSRVDLERFSEHVDAWASSFEFPSNPDHQLRPYLSIRHPARVAELIPEAPVFATADQIKRQLLYSHSIAIESPLQGFLPGHERGRMHRENLPITRLLNTIYDLEPLVRAGIVIYTPSFTRPGTSANPMYPVVARFVAEAADSMGDAHGPIFKKYVQTFVNDLDLTDYPPYAYGTSAVDPYLPDVDPAEVHFAFDAFNFLTDSLSVVAACGGAVDLALGYRHQDRALRLLSSSLGPSHTSPRTRTDFMQDLASVNLPALPHLSPADIVSIRTNDENFEVWRAGLSRGLVLMHSLPEASRPDVRELVAAELAEASLALRRGLAKRSVKRLLGAGLKDFALGSLGVVSATLVASDSVATAAPGLAGLAMATVARQLLTDRPDVSQNALALHYALFS